MYLIKTKRSGGGRWTVPAPRVPARANFPTVAYISQTDRR